MKTTAENSDEITRILEQEFSKGILKAVPKRIKSAMATSYASAVKAGENAFYAFKSKK